MFDEKVIISEQFPIPQKARKHTDVCCTFIGALFALSLFIVAVIVYSPNNYAQNFGFKDFDTCGSAYLHFPDVRTNPNNKVCLNGCPQGFGATDDRICLPEDDRLLEDYIKSTQVIKKKNNEGFIKTIFYSVCVALGLSILWMVLVFTIPKYIPIISAVCAIASLIAIAIATALSTQNFWGDSYNLRFIPFTLAILLIIILFVILFTYSAELKFQAIMLKYANVFLFDSEFTFFYIPIFLIFVCGLLALIWFQNMAFQSSFASTNDSWNLANSGIFSFLNLIELIWGLQFLRDAFNFCVGGNAIDWYWKGNSSTFSSMKRLLCKNWGSVVGGSFLNAFFGIPTLIVELLVCHPEACCSKAGTFCQNSCNPFTCFFDIVRTDAYSYINLSGVPFCDSARNCSHVCYKSKQFIGNHSSIKHFRFMAFTFLLSLLCFMTQWILNYRTFHICFWQLAIGVVILYAIVGWFIEIHTASAEALQTSYLVQFELQEGYKYMRRIFPSIRGELQFLDSQVKREGNC